MKKRKNEVKYGALHVAFLVCSQNQQFLKDIVTSVLEGQGVGFWKLGRVKTLMEDENYRNFVVSRLNTTLDRKLSDEDMHLEDVVRTVFITNYSESNAIIWR